MTDKYLLLVIVVTSVGSIHQIVGETYPFGLSHGDTSLTLEKWSTDSREIILLQSIPFLGDGTLSKIWVSPFGSISYNKVQDWRLKFISNNVIVSPFFVLSQQGPSAQIYFRQTDNDDILFQTLSRDIKWSTNQKELMPFVPNYAFVVTWDQLSSLHDSTMVNTFQLAVASDGNRTFGVFNYDGISWSVANGNYAAAGVFAIGDKSALCYHHFPASETIEVSSLSKNFFGPGNIGRHVFDFTDPLRCSSKFGSPCGLIPKADRGYYSTYFENTGRNSLGWEFYLLFSCQQGLSIKPNVVSQNVRCLYEADYYEFAWELRTPKCIDLNATRQFQTILEVANLSDTTLYWFNDAGEINSRIVDLVEETVIKLLDAVGITGTLTQIVSIRNSTIHDNKSETVAVEFTTYIPTYTNRKLTNNTMKDQISTGLDKEINLLTFNKDPITITDVTNKCLQACLCRMRFDPATCRTGKFRPDIQSDACCGDCYGIPYSSLIKACCVDKLYDPKKSVCCGGRIRAGNHCPDT